MNQSSTLLRKLILLASVAAAWTVVYGAAWAQEAEGGGGGGGGGGRLYIVSYFLVALCIVLGMLVVCRSARRRDAAKGEQFQVATYAVVGKGGKGVPVITVGMRVDQVNKMLGRPTISRRGDDIYRALAQAGRLSEEDAAKEYSIYDHPAGRYELVSLDKRVIEVKSQPKRPES